MVQALLKQYKIKERITKRQNAKEYRPLVLELLSIKLKKIQPTILSLLMQVNFYRDFVLSWKKSNQEQFRSHAH